MGRSPARPPDAGDGSVDLEERQLLVRHSSGDPKAFAELVARYRAPVYGYLIRSAVEPAECDDLFQEIFMRIHGAAWSYRPERPLRPWLFTIVANAVRSHFRKRRVRLLVFPPGICAADEPRAPACPGPNAHELLEAEQTSSRLDRALRRLPPKQREVVLLCCVERLSQHQVGEMLSMPVNTVKTHLRRARLALADALLDAHEELEA